MKKILCVITVIINLLCAIAVAEGTFTLHSGVTFGMPMGAIAAIEKGAGFSIKQTDSQLVIEGTIAGISGSRIIYYPDSHNKLFCAVYFLDYNTISNSVDNTTYAKLQSALEAKYGPSQFNSGNSMRADVPETLNDRYITSSGFVMSAYNKGWDPQPNMVAKYDQWLIPQDDGSYILIDHFLQSNYRTGTLSHYIIYTRIDAQTMDEWQLEKVDTQNAIMNDI